MIEKNLNKQLNSQQILAINDLIDNVSLQISMDKIEKFLSQPGYTKSEINDLTTGECVSDPIKEWGIATDNLVIPEKYKFCLSPTLINESDASLLISNSPNATAGIYLLYALPDKISRTTRPVRRIFCRPKPYCYKKSAP